MDLVFLEDFFHRKLPLKAKIFMTYFLIQSFTFCTKCISAAFEVTGCIVISTFFNNFKSVLLSRDFVRPFLQIFSESSSVPL